MILVWKWHMSYCVGGQKKKDSFFAGTRGLPIKKKCRQKIST